LRFDEARSDALCTRRVFATMAERNALQQGLRLGLCFLSREGPSSEGSVNLWDLRPAAVKAGVISQDDPSRFGWHNLRHSLATFFGSNDVHPSVIQRMLRHANQRTTARYIHPVNADQIAAQKKFLDAIKIRGTSHQIHAEIELGLNLGLGGRKRSL
jgi:integrase